MKINKVILVVITVIIVGIGVIGCGRIMSERRNHYTARVDITHAYPSKITLGATTYNMWVKGPFWFGEEDFVMVEETPPRDLDIPTYMLINWVQIAFTTIQRQPGTLYKLDSGITPIGDIGKKGQYYFILLLPDSINLYDYGGVWEFGINTRSTGWINIWEWVFK